jgi:hypothetical protein
VAGYLNRQSNFSRQMGTASASPAGALDLATARGYFWTRLPSGDNGGSKHNLLRVVYKSEPKEKGNQSTTVPKMQTVPVACHLLSRISQPPVFQSLRRCHKQLITSSLAVFRTQSEKASSFISWAKSPRLPLQSSRRFGQYRGLRDETKDCRG